MFSNPNMQQPQPLNNFQSTNFFLAPPPPPPPPPQPLAAVRPTPLPSQKDAFKNWNQNRQQMNQPTRYGAPSTSGFFPNGGIHQNPPPHPTRLPTLASLKPNAGGYHSQQPPAISSSSSIPSLASLQPSPEEEPIVAIYDEDGDYEAEEDDVQVLGRREEKLARKKGDFICEICNVQCSGEASYQAHLEGKGHRRRESSAQSAVPQLSLPKKTTAFHCTICNVDLSSANVYTAHINGQKHQKAIKLLIKANKPIPTSEATILVPTPENEEQQGKKPPPNKASLAAIPNEEFCDGLVLSRVEQIQLTAEQNDAVQQLVQFVEQTLYSVSAMIETTHSAQPGPAAHQNSQQTRQLRGIMRVGCLANNLLLRSDQRADLVVLTSTIPTLDLLRHVAHLFRDILNKPGKPIDFHDGDAPRVWLFHRVGIPLAIFVTLTCSAMRQWSPGDMNYHPYQEPVNALPKIPCLYALAEMRRTKFYQVRCEPHPAMNCVVKIVRDFGMRVQVWNQLSNWMIILIVEKTLSSFDHPLGPSASLKALFTTISEGSILSPDSQLADPCEKLPTDAISILKTAERTKIFASARYCLRQFNKNNLAKLLALDCTASDLSRKRNFSRDGSNENGIEDFQIGPKMARIEQVRPFSSDSIAVDFQQSNTTLDFMGEQQQMAQIGNFESLRESSADGYIGGFW